MSGRRGSLGEREVVLGFLEGMENWGSGFLEDVEVGFGK